MEKVLSAKIAIGGGENNKKRIDLLHFLLYNQ